MWASGMCRAQIYWLRDGVELRRGADPNVILAHDGSLIISSARVSDTGNYTCAARNVAMERHAAPAELSVYGTTLFCSVFMRLCWACLVSGTAHHYAHSTPMCACPCAEPILQFCNKLSPVGRPACTVFVCVCIQGA
jgi:hypothetical protein